VFIQTVKERAVHKVYLSAEAPATDKSYLLPHLCSRLAAAYVSGSEVLVGLTQSQRLYLGDKLFSSDCTSFSLTQTFLAFVKATSGLSHELFIYDLNRALPVSANPGTEAPKLASLAQESNFNVRAVERGARIVAINGARTVLQMPRGNLEGVAPRIMLLTQVI